jgi:signal transduction histidine kinase
MIAEPLAALVVAGNPGDMDVIAARLGPAPGGAPTQPVRLLRADSVAAACAALGHAQVDVVLLDLSLPDSPWLEALHRIRVAASGAPVVVLTGIADEALALEALRAGAQDYVLWPPPDGATLRRILRYARERQHLLQDLDVAVQASETAARRWRLLAEVSQCFAAGAHDPRAAIAEVAGLIVPDGADGVVLYLVGTEEVPPIVEVAHVDVRLRDEIRARLRDLITGAPGRDGGDSGKTEIVSRSLLASLGLMPSIAAPLYTGGEACGLVSLQIRQRPGAGAADDEFVRSLADRISLGLEQASMFRQTRRALAARDRAVGIVSHDLRNPLSTIQLCATALLDPEPPPVAGIRRMAQIILHSAGLVQQIAQDLLDRASLDAGRLALHREPTIVADVIGATQAMFAPMAEDQALELVVESATDLPPIDADPHRLVQVLSNLLSNALKFTPAGGRVALKARAADAEPGDPHIGGVASRGVRFTVSDTGPGIAPGDLAHVFDWFWQSPRSGGTGAGLGLAISKGLIEAHRARLHVESVQGQGTTFWFTLPAVAAEAASRPPERAVESAGRCR